MGREILVGERNWETIKCRTFHSGEIHVEWCGLDVTGELNGKGDIGV